MFLDCFFRNYKKEYIYKLLEECFTNMDEQILYVKSQQPIQKKLRGRDETSYSLH